MNVDSETLTAAVRLVVADQRLNADTEGETDAQLIVWFRNVVVPWDSEWVMGAVRADYIPDNPTSLAVDVVLRASADDLAQVLDGWQEATTSRG